MEEARPCSGFPPGAGLLPSVDFVDKRRRDLPRVASSRRLHPDRPMQKQLVGRRIGDDPLGFVPYRAFEGGTVDNRSASFY
jgi:hypothetical protein